MLGVRRLPIPSLRTPFPRPPAPHLSFPRLTDSTTTLYRQESSLLLGKVSLARACARACVRVPDDIPCLCPSLQGGPCCLARVRSAYSISR